MDFETPYFSALNFANIASRTIPNESKLTFEEFSVSLKNDDEEL